MAIPDHIPCYVLAPASPIGVAWGAGEALGSRSLSPVAVAGTELCCPTWHLPDDGAHGCGLALGQDVALCSLLGFEQLCGANKIAGA